MAIFSSITAIVDLQREFFVQQRLLISKVEIKPHLKTWSLDHSHPACQAEVTAEGMKIEMCDIVKSNPDEPVSVAREKVIQKHKENYIKNSLQCGTRFSSI